MIYAFANFRHMVTEFVLTDVATGGDQDRIYFVIIYFQTVVGHPYLCILDTDLKTRYC